jgi:trans-aconitate methyltransferase
VTYLSLPIRYTQPQSLAAVAAIFGHEAPHAHSARVLELGCASGGNIIPLAARFPEAHLTGLDIDAAGIDAARRHIATLGLHNIAVEAADIAAFDANGREFDYILCHGVFSWAPAHVQAAILQICAGSLSALTYCPAGVCSRSFATSA